MQVHSLFLLVALVTIPFCTSMACTDKSLLNGNELIVKDADVTKAYNKVASCATLTTDDNEMCCYIKIKFDNDQLDETFTQKGCYVFKTESYLNEDFDFDDDLIDPLEVNVTNSNNQIEVDYINIDCSSRFLQLVGLSLLLLLL